MNPFKVAGIVTKVGFQTTLGLVKGTINTAGDCCKLAGRVIDRDPEGAVRIIAKRVDKTVRAVGSVSKTAVHLVDTALDSNQSLWTEKNVEKMASVATFGAILAVGIDSVTGDEITDLPENSASLNEAGVPSDAVLASSFGLDADAVSNGVFVGDENDLNDLILAGEDSSSQHLSAGEYTRDIGLRDTFVNAHGWESIPEGYEVHHVMPLSQGGADNVDNMILISESEHDAVTAAHRAFYNW